MSRLALFILTYTLFASVSFTFASPVVNGELVNLEKPTTYTGWGSWYHPGVNECGYHSYDSDKVLKISHKRYLTEHAFCGQIVKINHKGKLAYGMIVGVHLESSYGDNDIDMSTSLFQEFAPLSTHVINVTWSFQK